MQTVVSDTGGAICLLWLDDHEADDKKCNDDDSKDGKHFAEETPAPVLPLPIPLPLLIPATNHHHRNKER